MCKLLMKSKSKTNVLVTVKRFMCLYVYWEKLELITLMWKMKKLLITSWNNDTIVLMVSFFHEYHFLFCSSFIMTFFQPQTEMTKIEYQNLRYMNTHYALTFKVNLKMELKYENNFYIKICNIQIQEKIWIWIYKIPKWSNFLK